MSADIALIGSGHRMRRGFIVIAVMWLVAALAALAGLYAVFVAGGASAMPEYENRLRARAAAVAGVELAVSRLILAQRDPLPSAQFSFPLGDYSVDVDLRSENGRIDLNLASKDLLIRAFAAAGADGEAAEGFATRVIAKRTPPSASDEGDAAFAKSVGRSSDPLRGAFQHTSELAAIGIPPAVAARALDYFTVYSGQAEINPLSASREVLALLPGLTPERIATLMLQRSAPQDVLNAQLGSAAQLVTFRPGRATRIRVVAPLAANRRLAVETVVLVTPQGSEPYRVLTWAERLD